MMQKEDVLAKSRAEQKDEYEEKVNIKGSYWGMIILMVACMFFAATKVINDGQPFFEFPAILFAYLSGTNLYSYIKMKKAEYFVAFFGFAFAFICMTVLYFINM